MLRIFVSFAAICFFFQVTTGQSYPDYNTVVSKFFYNYSIANVSQNEQLQFQKRPAGWFVTVVDYYNPDVKIKDELFWDRNKNKFKKIGFKKVGDFEENREEYNKYINDWSKVNFNFCPYFGYAGWDWDVIQDYKDAVNLPDSTLYALGRAYSSYAGNLLNNNSGLADKSQQFVLPAGKNSLSAEQLEKYRYYRHLAIENFNKVAKMNPDYETIVGTIGVKAANEHLTSFLDMRMYQNEDEARKEITDGLYSDFMVSVAKNYLNSCAPNAILFTNGDNDTFPLLYVQSVYGVRTDVLVVNMSLLQTDRYINSLREQILSAPPLPVSLTPEEISGNNRDVIIIEAENDNPIEITDLIKFIKDDNNLKPYGTVKYHYSPTNKFKLNNEQNPVEWEVNLPYFFKNQLIMLDMLGTNNWNRPVYFATTMSDEYFFGLADFFQLEGLAYKLTPFQKSEKTDVTGIVNSSILYDNIMNKFEWKGIENIKSHELLLCKNYRNNFSRLAESLIAENKNDSARIILDKCIDVFPNDKVFFDYFLISVIESYYKIKDYDKGNQIAKQLVFNLKNKENNPRLAMRKDYRDASLNWIKQLATEYNQREILNEL